MATLYGRVNYKRDVDAENPYEYWGFTGSCQRVELDDPSKPVYKTVRLDEQYSLFGSMVESVVTQQVGDYITAMNMQETEILDKTFYPVITHFSGEFLTVPKPLYSEFPTVKSNNQPRYAKAKRNGDIVVSDYQRGYVRVDFEPAQVISGLGRTSRSYVPLHELLGVPQPSKTNPVRIGGGLFSALPRISTTRQQATITESLGDYNFDMPAFKRQVLGTLPNGNATTSKCVASANGGTVDLATSLAEMPKSMKGLLAGCKLILNMYKDAKRREFRATDRIKKVRHEWDKELSRASNIKEKDAATHATKVLQFEKTTNNLLHEIASIWLTYRLEILPVASSIEGTIDGLVLGYASSEYVRFRETENALISIPNCDGKLPVEFRCFIKRRLIAGAEWQSFFSVNLTKTLWELTWLSFVLDRYVAVGDWILANLSSPSDYTLQEGATKSWKIDNQIRCNGKRITVKLNKRIVFSPDSYCQLRFPSSRSDDQRLDHLALAWAILVKKL